MDLLKFERVALLGLGSSFFAVAPGGVTTIMFSDEPSPPELLFSVRIIGGFQLFVSFLLFSKNLDDSACRVMYRRAFVGIHGYLLLNGFVCLWQSFYTSSFYFFVAYHMTMCLLHISSDPLSHSRKEKDGRS